MDKNLNLYTKLLWFKVNKLILSLSDSVLTKRYANYQSLPFLYYCIYPEGCVKKNYFELKLHSLRNKKLMMFGIYFISKQTIHIPAFSVDFRITNRTTMAKPCSLTDILLQNVIRSTSSSNFSPLLSKPAPCSLWSTSMMKLAQVLMASRSNNRQICFIIKFTVSVK